MTDITNSTHALEQALDANRAVLDRYKVGNPDNEENIERLTRKVDAVIDEILDIPLTTLGIARLHAKALMDSMTRYEGTKAWHLLKAIEALPPRLWAEPIATG